MYIARLEPFFCPSSISYPSLLRSNRRGFSRLLAACSLLGLSLATAGCTNSSLTSIQVTPGAGSQVLSGAGETAQFTATGTYTRGKYVPSTRDITKEATWASSDASVATINSSGVVTAMGQGTSVITASMQGGFGNVTGTSNVVVTGSLTPNLSSLAIIPGSQTVNSPGETTQFIAIGTFNGSTPPTKDVTNQISWKSSDVAVARINSSGLATGIGAGSTTITGIATGANGGVITATASFTETSAPEPVALPTLTVYEVGNGTGVVTGTAVDLEGNVTPVVLDCGSGLGCVANFTVGSKVTLVANADKGPNPPSTSQPPSKFDGWSANCTLIGDPQNPSCLISMDNNNTVGAIFDLNPAPPPTQ